MDLSNLAKTFESSTNRVLEVISDREQVGKIGKVVAISAATYLAATKLYDAYFGPLSSIPGPFFAKFFRIRKASLDKPLGTGWKKLYEYHDKYGKVVRLGPNSIMIADKDMLKQVLVKEDFRKAPNYDLLKQSHEQTMFNTRDKVFHKQRRRVISPAFSVKYLNSLETFMHSVTQSFLKRIDQEIAKTRDADGYGVVDMWVLFQCLALDIIGETAFGQTFNMIENNDHFVPRTITSGMKVAQYLINDPLLGPLLIKLRGKRLSKPRLQLNKFMEKIIIERIRGGEAARRDDILQILIDTQHAHEHEDRLTAEAIASETVLFLIAGSETTSNTSGFALIELLRHPDKLAKLREEIDALPVGEDGIFKHEQLKHLPYLNGVINEALRIDWIGRDGIDRIVEQDTNLAGRLVVPRGTIVTCNIYHAQMDPDYWTNPQEFMPERWFEDADPAPEIDAFYPFSAGSRNCIGKNFALQEMRIALATLVKHYDLKPIPQELKDAERTVQYLTAQVEKNSFKVLMKRRST